MFGPNVHIYAATHPIEVEPRRASLELAYPITVYFFLRLPTNEEDRRRLLDWWECDDISWRDDWEGLRCRRRKYRYE